MATILSILGVFLLLLACAAGLLSLVFGLPGTFFIVLAALLYAWATDFATVHAGLLLWLTALAVLGEGIEFVAAARSPPGTRPSRRVTLSAIAGAVVGGIAGAPFFFGAGSLPGALAGAFAGAALAVASEGGTAGESLRTGFAALRGRLLGFVLKSSIAVVMIVVLLAGIFRS